MRITDKIHEIENVKGAHCYIVDTAEGLLLVDAGLPGNGDTIIRYIEGIGRRPDEIKYIVLTHCDLDHSGDALLCDEEGRIKMHRPSFALDEQQGVQSAERIKVLGFRILLPGHNKLYIDRARA